VIRALLYYPGQPQTKEYEAADKCRKLFSLNLRCDKRFTHVFTAYGCVFKEITLVESNQGNYFENVTACSKRMRKTLVATQLYIIFLFPRDIFFSLGKWSKTYQVDVVVIVVVVDVVDDDDDRWLDFLTSSPWGGDPRSVWSWLDCNAWCEWLSFSNVPLFHLFSLCFLINCILFLYVELKSNK